MDEVPGVLEVQKVLTVRVPAVPKVPKVLCDAEGLSKFRQWRLRCPLTSVFRVSRRLIC